MTKSKLKMVFVINVFFIYVRSLAGTLGFEPRTEILEIPMIPFHHVPSLIFSFLSKFYYSGIKRAIFQSRWYFIVHFTRLTGFPRRNALMFSMVVSKILINASWLLNTIIPYLTSCLKT